MEPAVCLACAAFGLTVVAVLSVSLGLMLDEAAGRSCSAPDPDRLNYSLIADAGAMDRAAAWCYLALHDE
jgi:hypothetical protein